MKHHISHISDACFFLFSRKTARRLYTRARCCTSIFPIQGWGKRKTKRTCIYFFNSSVLLWRGGLMYVFPLPLSPFLNSFFPNGVFFLSYWFGVQCLHIFFYGGGEILLAVGILWIFLSHFLFGENPNFLDFFFSFHQRGLNRVCGAFFLLTACFLESRWMYKKRGREELVPM
ncbi:hypothetical protein BDD12DRAFT_98014 [Trichophaea hybrida]|nr:hypothetical protein BDD12DRAFT_98014 [Trichophaea hybrida]